MIALFRRHVAACKFTSRKDRFCRCPIWAEGTVHGEKIRRSLDLRNREAAVRLVREWETHAPQGTLSVSDACDQFISGAQEERRNKL
jgi:hypothetical protein